MVGSRWGCKLPFHLEMFWAEKTFNICFLLGVDKEWCASYSKLPKVIRESIFISFLFFSSHSQLRTVWDHLYFFLEYGLHLLVSHVYLNITWACIWFWRNRLFYGYNATTISDNIGNHIQVECIVGRQMDQWCWSFQKRENNCMMDLGIIFTFLESWESIIFPQASTLFS